MNFPEKETHRNRTVWSGKRLTINGDERHFWDDGNILSLDFGDNYTIL
jgi:hypothetical protein